MEIDALLIHDTASVARKFLGQQIGPAEVQREMQWGYNRAARTIESLISSGLAVKSGPGPYTCKLHGVPAEVEYSDDAVPEPTADDYRQLQLMHDELQSQLFNEQQKTKELTIQVERLQTHNEMLMQASWEMKEGLPDAYYKIKNIRNTTPAQCLADRDAEVAEKYYYMGWEHSLSTKADDGNHYACGKRLAAEFANQLRQPAKAGE